MSMRFGTSVNGRGEDLELKEMQRELSEYHKIEHKEYVKGELEQMRRKHGNKLDADQQQRVNTHKKAAEAAGFRIQTKEDRK